jgi:hypothetical protein
MIPVTENRWAQRIKETPRDQRLDLIASQPVVAWFSNKKTAANRLIKITARLGDDLWIIHGWDLQGNGLVTPSPTSLDSCLGYLTAENGWVLCEFSDERKFIQAVQAYIR